MRRVPRPTPAGPSRSVQYRKRGSSIFWCTRAESKPRSLMSSTSARSASADGLQGGTATSSPGGALSARRRPVVEQKRPRPTAEPSAARSRSATRSRRDRRCAAAPSRRSGVDARGPSSSSKAWPLRCPGRLIVGHRVLARAGGGDGVQLTRPRCRARSPARFRPGAAAQLEPHRDTAHRPTARPGSSAAGSIGGSCTRLQPDRLPDARGAVVPDGVRIGLPVLLAARLGDVERVVLGADDHRLLGPPRGHPSRRS